MSKLTWHKLIALIMALVSINLISLDEKSMYSSLVKIANE